MSVNDKEMTATFKIANTTAGTDALEEAMDGLRDGFSIELAVDNYEMQKDGTMKVLNGQLIGVALVTEPAVRSARVSEVAASEDSETETVTETTNPNEGDKVDNTTEPAAPAVEPVEAPEVAAPVQASRPAYYTAPRSPIVSKVSYLEHYLKATILHDEDSRQYIKAADNTTSTAPGMIPTPQSTQIVNALANADRGMIDALSQRNSRGRRHDLRNSSGNRRSKCHKCCRKCSCYRFITFSNIFKRSGSILQRSRNLHSRID
jgi:hypothetical protein